jgi:hypothetical protein
MHGAAPVLAGFPWGQGDPKDRGDTETLGTNTESFRARGTVLDNRQCCAGERLREGRSVCARVVADGEDAVPPGNLVGGAQSSVPVILADRGDAVPPQATIVGGARSSVPAILAGAGDAVDPEAFFEEEPPFSVPGLLLTA